MNRSLPRAVLIAALCLAPVCAAAYPAQFATRPFAQKQADDDLVVCETAVAAPWLQFRGGGGVQRLTIEPNGRGSITVTRTNTVTPDLGPAEIQVDSLDRMFPGDLPGARIKWRFALTADFLWVEAQTADDNSIQRAPTYSTVFFFGAPQAVYDNLIRNGPNSTNSCIRYGKLRDLMNDVQNNYAKWQGYPYNLPPGPFLYNEKMRVAIFGGRVID